MRGVAVVETCAIGAGVHEKIDLALNSETRNRHEDSDERTSPEGKPPDNHQPATPQRGVVETWVNSMITCLSAYPFSL